MNPMHIDAALIRIAAYTARLEQALEEANQMLTEARSRIKELEGSQTDGKEPD